MLEIAPYDARRLALVVARAAELFDLLGQTHMVDELGEVVDLLDSVLP